MSAFTWMPGGYQSDSWTASETGQGCWETKAAAATTRAGLHLENTTEHTQTSSIINKRMVKMCPADGIT